MRTYAPALRYDGYLYYEASSGGHLNILKWLHATSRRSICPWITESSYIAGANGHVEVLKWLGAIHILPDSCLIDVSIIAARRGYIDILKWACDKGVQWTDPVGIAAVEGGKLDILKWLKANGYPRHSLCNRDMWKSAIATDHFDVLKWLVSVGCKLEKKMCLYASTYGKVEILEWLRAAGL
jgi:hypothetical protein